MIEWENSILYREYDYYRWEGMLSLFSIISESTWNLHKNNYEWQWKNAVDDTINKKKTKKWKKNLFDYNIQFMLKIWWLYSVCVFFIKNIHSPHSTQHKEM